MARWFTVTTLLAVLVGCASWLPQGPAVLPRIRLVATEVPLQIEPGIDWNSLRICRDPERVAYAAKRGDKWVAVVDGVAGKEYDAITIGRWWYDSVFLDFSPNCERFAHTSRRGQAWLVVVDGVEGNAYDSIVETLFWSVGRKHRGFVQFSPDSMHVEHTARRDGRWLLIRDGVEQGPHDPYDSRFFEQRFYTPPAWIQPEAVQSPDGKRVAIFHYLSFFGPSSKLMMSLVVDGVEYRAYDHYGLPPSGANRPVFGPDSKHVAHLGRRGNQYFIVVDGVEGPSYEVTSYADVQPYRWDYANFFVKFDSPTRCHMFAVRDGRLLRVELEIVPG